MKKIRDLIGHELKWSQRKQLMMEYELHDAGELVGILRFRSSFGSLATAENEDGCWTFKRVGFLQTRAIIRKSDSDQDIAVFRNSTWSDGGTLELPDGRRYLANSNFWMTSFDFKTEAGQPLVRFHRISGVLHLSSMVDILPAAGSLPELPWLVPFGWYLTVMMQMDASASAAMGTI